MNYEQITQVWQQFMAHKFTASTAKFSEEVRSFLTTARVDFVDMETLDYLEHGHLIVRYLDLLQENEEIEIRRMERVDGSGTPTWGLPGKDEKKQLNIWLSARFALPKQQVNLICGWVDMFLRAVLKNETN